LQPNGQRLQQNNGVKGLLQSSDHDSLHLLDADRGWPPRPGLVQQPGHEHAPHTGDVVQVATFRSFVAGGISALRHVA
jgi:hypothetical protein